MAVFFDTHAHLDYPDFAADFAQLIERAQSAGIVKMISIGTDLESSARAIRLAEQHPCIYAVAGWHPEWHRHSLEIMHWWFGDVVPSAEVMEAWEKTSITRP